jgi:hypothetical protein
MRRLLIAIFAAGCTLWTPNAAAQTREDFVFNVPVRIENASPLDGVPVQVRCSVRAYAGGVFTSAPMAAQSVTVGPTGYTGTVRLAVTLPDGVRRADVRDWNCSLMINRARNSRGEILAVPGPNVEARVTGYTTVTGQTVATHNVDEMGNFTW